MPYLQADSDFYPLQAVEGAAEDPTPQKKASAMGKRERKAMSSAAPEQRNDKFGGGAIKKAPNSAAPVEWGMDNMEGVEYASPPPSPPSSGTATPTLREERCPPRLRPLVPPPNYGVVKDENIFRSAFPHDRNIEFLRSLGIKTVLGLVGTEPSLTYREWVHNSGIKRRQIDIAPNKDDKIQTTLSSLCEALLVVMDCTNYPLYVHCNQGRHRTGCVVACFRKIQRWPIEDVLAEYDTYANPKARAADEDLIRAFDPDSVFQYAKAHGYLDNPPLMRRMDSTITNIGALAEALASKNSLDDPGADNSSYMSRISSASTISEDGLEMGLLTLQPGHERNEPSSASLRLPPGPPSNHSGPVGTNHLEQPGDGTRSADENGLSTVVATDGSGTSEATTTVTELSEDAMTPPPANIPNPLAQVDA